MTDAIEAGARAIARHIPLDFSSRWNPGHGENFPQQYTEAECGMIRTIAKACIEAAIASGALVPASAVAEMRERCAAKCDAVAKDWSGDADHFAQKQNFHRANVSLNHKNGAEECASKIRQLDTAPSCGDYVVVPREEK